MLRDKRRPAIGSPALDWSALGFEPRWVGFDTADCVAALQPSIFSGQGADEFNRFRRGAESRGELAIVISPIGKSDDEPRSVLAQHDNTVHFGKIESTIASRPLGTGARVRAVEHLSDADRNLALRLTNCNPPLPWRSLSLHGVTYEAHNGHFQHPPQGRLDSIVETELGEPVIAAWVSPEGVERRYVVPAEAPWPLLLQWLLEHAMPEYAPKAMRRARRPLASDQTLMTRRERTASAALADFDAEYQARRAELERELEEAQTAALGVRDGLLYGTGTQLVDAVSAVLMSAGVTVVDLDVELGGTINADLFCTYGGRSRLVEVKSASGNPPERAYEDLVRHIRGWPKLPVKAPVEGGALVLNHQHRAMPNERSPQPYGRPEFLASQTEPIITTLDLFAAWSEEDSDAVHRLFFPDPPGRVAPAAGHGSPSDAADGRG